jgi:hypothetical protein
MARKQNGGSDKVTESAGGGQEGHGFTSEPISKADAARAVLDDGIESPVEAVEVIKNRFGIEMTRGHFSAEKARYMERRAEAKPAVRRGRPPKVATPQEATAPVARERAAAPSQTAGVDSDLLTAMEAMKPLVEQMGADKVKRIVDLLG